jgi:hypothetical protein
MKFVNNTQWNTTELRRLTLAIMKHVGVNAGRTSITINDARKDYVHGLATIGHGWVKMWTPTPKNKPTFDVVTYTQVLEHELEHNLGLRHTEMKPCFRKDVSYTKDYVINPKPIRVVLVKPKPSIIMKRQAQAKAKVARLEHKLDLTQALLKKWRKKLAYYDKKSSI